MSSSAHIATSKHGAVTHNARENFSHSVVFTDEKNELWNNTKEAYSIYRKELAERAKAYTNRTKQKLQKKTSTKLSVVVNLLQHHTLKDIKDIQKYLEKSLDTKVYQVAIHRDEGKLISKEDGTELYSGKDFFKNPANDELYYDKKYTKKIDLSKYTIKKNYHAHIEMLGIDSTGAAIRHNKMHKHFLKELQDITAETLKMERTYSPGKKRLDTHKFKEVGQAQQQQKRATQALLKKEIAKLREELKESGAVRKDYAALEQLNRELKQKIKKKELTEAELKEALEEQEQLNNTLKKEKSDLVKKYNNVVKKIKNVNEVYTEVAQALDVETNSYEQARDDIISKYKSTKQEVAELKKTIETLKEENSDLEQEVKFAEQRESEMQSFRFNYYSSSNKSYELQKQLRNARETIEAQKTTIDTLKEEKSVLKAKYEEIREAFEDVAQKLSIKIDTFKQVATDIISKFKSTKETETVTETDDAAWERMKKNAKKTEKRQSLKLK